MRRRWITSGVVTTVAAGLTLGGVTAFAAPAKTTRLTCGLQLFAQGPPQGTPPGGIQFGLATCPAPFGRGVHYDTYTVTPVSPGHGTIAGTFRNYYARGTARGTFALTFAASSQTQIAYSGTVTYTGGTGAFRRVHGRGTIACTTTDGGAHKACTVKSALTGL